MLRKDLGELRKKYKIPFIPYSAYKQPSSNKCTRNKRVNYRIIRKYTLDGKLVSRINFNKRNCDENGLNYSGILLASKPTWEDNPKQLKSMNHIWIRESDFSEEELQKKVELNRQSKEKIDKIRKKKIAKTCINSGEIIETFESIDSASRTDMYYNARCIRRVLSGERKTYAGFGWKFLES